MATFADLNSIELDANTAEDSISFLSALLDKPSDSPRSEIVHHSISGRFAIRRDNWKLLLAPGSGGWSAPTDAQASKRGLPPTQFYDLTEDPSEQRNLIERHPEIASQLVELLKHTVDRDRSTPGQRRANDAKFDIWKLQFRDIDRSIHQVRRLVSTDSFLAACCLQLAIFVNRSNGLG